MICQCGSLPGRPQLPGTSGRYTSRASGPFLGVRGSRGGGLFARRSEEHTSELQSRLHLVCRLLLEYKFFNSKEKKLYTRFLDQVGRNFQGKAVNTPLLFLPLPFNTTDLNYSACPTNCNHHDPCCTS